MGETKRMRMKRVIRVGPMEEVVGVWPTERKVVTLENGSVRIVHRAERSWRVSRMSSRDGCSSSIR